MIINEIRTFLEAPRIAYLSNIDLQGYPHTVPVWFAVDGDDLIFSAAKKRARVKQILANSKGCVVIGGNTNDAEGYLIKGDFKIEDDPSFTLRDKVLSRYLQGKSLEQFLASLAGEERVIFRLIPLSVIRVH
jgi:general stress protein 26